MQAPDFWQRDNASLLPTLLAPLAWAYGLGARMRFKLVKPYKAPVPVLCIGNLSVGGTGKTPVAINLGQRLAASGMQPHFLSRGYGGSATGPMLVDSKNHTASEVGDEALLLARCAPVWVAGNRPAGANKAVKDGATVIIMDDGFQNPSLTKDVSLLVVDGNYGFGNGRLMPAGPLRETIKTGLRRADAVIIIGDDKAGIGETLSQSTAKDMPVLHAGIKPGPEAAAFKDKNVVAFAGTGMPEKFFTTLRSTGCNLISSHSFDDHHPYNKNDIRRMRACAKKTASLLVTTAKDAVRLPPDERQGIDILTISVVWNDEAALNAILKPLSNNDR